LSIFFISSKIAPLRYRENIQKILYFNAGKI
jgi:hypothetical protein